MIRYLRRLVIQLECERRRVFREARPLFRNLLRCPVELPGSFMMFVEVRATDASPVEIVKRGSGWEQCHVNRIRLRGY